MSELSKENKVLEARIKINNLLEKADVNHLIRAEISDLQKSIVENLTLSDVSKSVLYEDKNLIDNMCLSYRHDFGLMNLQERNELRVVCSTLIKPQTL